MVYLAPTVLAAATVSKFPTWELWIFVAIGLGLGMGFAELRRWLRGAYPWRMHSVIWGLLVVFSSGFVLPLLAVAWFTTKPRPGDIPGRGHPRPPLVEMLRARRNTPYRRAGAVPAPAPMGMAPGTYGTSLPPHERPAPADGPAGWFPDPTGRHEHRYWSGSYWSRHVADAGQRSTDDL